jgi:hypothetical protein
VGGGPTSEISAQHVSCHKTPHPNPPQQGGRGTERKLATAQKLPVNLTLITIRFASKIDPQGKPAGWRSIPKLRDGADVALLIPGGARMVTHPCSART